MRRKQDLTDTLTPIDDAKTYPMATFLRAVGWGRHALREARKRGLRVVRVGGRCYVRGRDFSEFLASIAERVEAE